MFGHLCLTQILLFRIGNKIQEILKSKTENYLNILLNLNQIFKAIKSSKNQTLLPISCHQVTLAILLLSIYHPPK